MNKTPIIKNQPKKEKKFQRKLFRGKSAIFSIKKFSKYFFLVSVFFSGHPYFFALQANDITLPSYPVDPDFPQVQQNPANRQNPRSSETKNQIPPSTMKVEIIAILGTTDEVRGYILLPEKISFKHYKNGLVYDKTIGPEELQSINIQEYAKEDDGSKGKSAFFQFEPSAVEIRLKDNSSYRIHKIFSFLKSFYIDTNNGRTKLFTIFGDAWEKTKGWRDAESKDPEYHRTHPHPASVKKIIFIRVEREQ